MTTVNSWEAAFRMLAAHLEAFQARWGEAGPLGDGSGSEGAALHRLADHLAAGRAFPVARWDPPARLRTIFARIAGGDGVAGEHALRALDRSRETLFPHPEGDAAAMEGEYRALAQQLGAALGPAMAAAQNHPAAKVAALQGLMARFLWCVPVSSEEDFRDIPLYDHSRVAAAWMAILAEAPEDQRVAWEQALAAGSEGPPMALLIHGDISGIQSFLYRVSGKGTARGLRGRSLYLQLLAEAVALFLLRRLELPLVNLLYSGGGHFWILARASDEDRLPDLQGEVERRLIAFHGMDLGLVLVAEPLRPAHLRPGGLSRALQAIAGRIGEAKRRRFAGSPPDLWRERLLRTDPAPTGPGTGEWADCSICGRVGRLEPQQIREVSPNLRKCRRCSSLEDLGRSALDLVALAWLWLKDEAPIPQGAPAEFTPWAEVFPAFGVRPVLLCADDGILEATGPLPDFEWALVWAVDERAYEDPFYAQITARLGQRPAAFIPRFLLRYAPIVTEEDRRDFEDQYAAREEEVPQVGTPRDFEILEGRAQGMRRLGVLRADLDRAGWLFSEGLGEHLTLSRMMALSGALSRFFEGYVETLCREADERRGGSGVLYALYSGGDDLFLVGAWDVVVQLAAGLRRDLADYTGGHPRLGLSAGLTLHEGREAVRRMADAAGEALEAAKAYEDPARGREKDALTFLDRTIPWKPGEAFEAVQEWQDRFVQLVAEAEGDPRRSGRGRSLLFALIRWAILIQQHREQGPAGDRRPVIGRWIWQFPYFLRRWMDAEPDGGKARQILEAMREEWERRDPAGQAALIETIWGPAARWAEMRTRRSEERSR